MHIYVEKFIWLCWQAMVYLFRKLANMGKFIEKAEISLHLVKVWETIKSKDGKWISNKEIAEEVKFSERTVRAHTLYLVKAGLIDQAEVYPAHRYRFSKMSAKRNAAFVKRIELASEILNNR